MLWQSSFHYPLLGEQQHILSIFTTAELVTFDNKTFFVFSDGDAFSLSTCIGNKHFETCLTQNIRHNLTNISTSQAGSFTFIRFAWSCFFVWCIPRAPQIRHSEQRQVRIQTAQDFVLLDLCAIRKTYCDL